MNVVPSGWVKLLRVEGQVRWWEGKGSRGVVEGLSGVVDGIRGHAGVEIKKSDNNNGCWDPESESRQGPTVKEEGCR